MNEKIEYSFISEHLHQKSSITIVSDDMFGNSKFLICFHGLGGSKEDFIYKSNLLLEVKNTTVIFIDGHRSFYVNSKSGQNFNDFILKEVITKVSLLVNKDMRNIYLLGFSMGGYGAMKLFLENDIFKGIFSISGSLDIKDRDKYKRSLNNYIKDEWISMFGESFSDENDLFLKANNFKNKKVILACGEDDHLLYANQKFSEKFNCKLDISEGEHDYHFVSLMIKKHIKGFING